MKIAVFGDLHAHNFKLFDSHSELTGSRRLDNIVGCLRYIRDYCVSEGIRLCLFTGDMFHVRAKVDTSVYNAVYDEIKTFSERGIELVMIAGNHDQYDNSDVPQHSLHAFNDLKDVWVYGDWAYHPIDDKVGIFCVPYSKNVGAVKDRLSNLISNDRAGKDYICLFHLGVTGGVTGTGSYPLADAFTVGDLRPDFFKYIIGGHFHIRQSLGGYPHVWYTGAPIQHDFGDEGQDKGFLVIDTSKRWDVQAIPIPNPQFRTMSGEVTGVTSEVLESWAANGDYVRLQVSEQQLQDYMDIIPPNLQYKVELQKEYQEQIRVDVKIGMSFSEIIAKYAEEFNPDARDIGLQILSEVEGA